MSHADLALRAERGALRAWTFTASEHGLCTNSHVLANGTDAIVVDGQFLPTEAARLASAVTAHGLVVRAIYVTHAHPDHYFGLDVLRAQWPAARVLALPEVVAEIDATYAAKHAFWMPTYGAELPTVRGSLPEAAARADIEAALTLGPLVPEVHVLGPAESMLDTVLHVPALALVVAGDLVYRGSHAWLGEHRPSLWLAAIDELRVRFTNATVWLPGHGPGGGRELLDDTATYIDVVRAAIATCNGDLPTARATVLARYPDHRVRAFLDITLTRWLMPGALIR